MARGTEADVSTATRSHSTGRPGRFGAPAELDPKFGAHHVTEDYIQGLVKTEDVRALLDAFGLTERRDIAFPFQHMKRMHGEVYGLRIEVAQHHSMEGQPVMAHVWSFQNHSAEKIKEAE